MIFKNEQFATVVPWLMLNREGLDILLHPLTDDMVDDHTVYATWLGQPVGLVLDHMQRRGYREALLPKAQAA
jgi:aromatic ring-cleaving dioxygenase